jgi:hypothetical protein
MALRNTNYMMDYEDTGGFGGDLFSDFYNGDNGFRAAPLPLIQPTPEPAASQFDPVQALFASQPAAPVPVAQPAGDSLETIRSALQLSQPTSPMQDADVVRDVTGLPALNPRQAVQPAQPTQPEQPAKPAGPAPEVLNALTQQILGSSDTSRWSGAGFGSAEKNAADMARILANAGLTDVRQLGVKQVVVPAQYYESGETPEHTVNTYYNKETGQDLGNLGGTYAERQTGNFFGGTFEGKGNTGYGVQFGPDGTPYFYTQGASSNDVAKIMEMAGPVGQIAAAYFGGPAAVAAISAASGKPVGDIIKSAALSYLGGAAGDAVSGIEGITNVLGETGTNIVSNAAKQFVGSGGKVDPVQALLAGGVNAGVNSLAGELGFDKLDPSTQKLVSTGITGLVAGKTPEQIAIDLAMAGLNTKPDNKLTSSLGPGDMDEFNASLIPGYFQPGGEGYIPPEETNPITVQQEPTGLDDFLKQLEQFKQAAVTPDDIQKIISGQNFATPEDIQTAINTIDIPKGLSEQDVQAIVSNAFAENPGIDISDVQSVVDAAVSKIPAGVSQEDLTRSLGATEQNVMAQVGKQGEQFQTLFDQYRQLGMDADTALRQTIDDLGTDVGSQLTDVKSQIADVQTGLGSQISQQSEQFQTLLQQYRDLGLDENTAIMQTIDDLESSVGSQLTDVKGQIADVQTGLGSQISQQGEQFQTLLQQYRDLGMDENEALRQTIDDLGSDVSGQLTDVKGQISQQGEQFQTLLQQYRDLGMEESDAIRQTIDDLGSTFGEQLSGLESGLSGQLSEQSEQFKTLLQQYRDLGMDEDEAMRQTIDDLGSSLSDLSSEFGGQLSGLRGDIKSQIDEVNTEITNIADALGTTEEELMNRLNLSEEELRNLIGGVGEETKAGLEKQSEATKAQFLNLTAAQKAQADALAKQGTDLTSAINQVQSTSNLNTLMMLLGSQQQQPVQQTTMQDPYADIKLMEDLFGSDIDLTPAGERTAQRK